jgi:hypothetical protein
MLPRVMEVERNWKGKAPDRSLLLNGNYVSVLMSYTDILFICTLFNDALSVTQTIQRGMKG